MLSCYLRDISLFEKSSILAVPIEDVRRKCCSAWMTYDVILVAFWKLPICFRKLISVEGIVDIICQLVVRRESECNLLLIQDIRQSKVVRECSLGSIRSQARKFDFAIAWAEVVEVRKAKSFGCIEILLSMWLVVSSCNFDHLEIDCLLS